MQSREVHHLAPARGPQVLPRERKLASEWHPATEVSSELAVSANGSTAPVRAGPGQGARGRRERWSRAGSAAILLLACPVSAWTPAPAALPVVTEIEIVPSVVAIA